MNETGSLSPGREHATGSAGRSLVTNPNGVVRALPGGRLNLVPRALGADR